MEITETAMLEYFSLGTRRALLAVNADYRMALLLRTVEGLNLREIGALMKITPPAVANKLRRAVRAMDRELSGGQSEDTANLDPRIIERSVKLPRVAI